jgi:hypothetical protein
MKEGRGGREEREERGFASRHIFFVSLVSLHAK